MKRKLRDLLYIEDDATDVEFARIALGEAARADLRLAVIPDGEQALKFLVDQDADDGRLPDMILLDLNLPKVNGKEILRTIKSSERLKRIPVVILTTSSFQRDIDETYALGASGYFTKPAGLDAYKATFAAICRYWADHAAIPSKFQS